MQGPQLFLACEGAASIGGVSINRGCTRPGSLLLEGPQMMFTTDCVLILLSFLSVWRRIYL